MNRTCHGPRLLALIALLFVATVEPAASGPDYRIVFDNGKLVMESDDQLTPYFDSRYPIHIVAENVPCGASYEFVVDEVAIPDVGVEVFGLEDIVGLASVVAAPPAALGIEALERITAATTSVEALVREMSTPQGAANVLANARQLAIESEDARTAGERGAKAYAAFAHEWLGRIQVQEEVPGQKLGEKLETQLEGIKSASSPLPPADAHQDQACSQFRQAIKNVNVLLGETRMERTRFSENRLASFPSRLRDTARAARERIPAIRDYFGRLSAAQKIARELLHTTGNGYGTEHFFAELQRLAAVAGDGVSRDALHALAARYARESAPLVEGILDQIEQVAGNVDGSGSAIESLNALINSTGEVLRNQEYLSDGFRRYNRRLRRLLVELEDLRQRSRRSVHVRTLNFDGNHDLTVKVFEKVQYSVPSLEGLDDLTIDFGSIEETGGEVAVLVEDPPQATEVATGRFEVHHTYRWNAGGGIFYSTLEEPEFGVRQRAMVDDTGAPVLNDDGSPRMEPYLAETGSSSGSIRYAAVVEIFFGRRFDAYPGAGGGRNLFGAALGLGLQDPGDNLFVGAFYQPTLGVQITAGYHLGKVDEAELGFSVNDALPIGTTEAPIREADDGAFFVGLTLDARVFRRFFAGGGD